MKRDVRLRELSREHHHALALARFVATREASRTIDASVVALVRERFASEIFPHFATEELLLDALAAHGGGDLVARTRDDHARMTRLVEAASPDDAPGLGQLARLLTEHVRFEERELYPACEERLPADVLDRVAGAHHDERAHDGGSR